MPTIFFQYLRCIYNLVVVPDRTWRLMESSALQATNSSSDERPAEDTLLGQADRRTDRQTVRLNKKMFGKLKLATGI